MTYDDDVPVPEPRNDLVPPPRHPPTVVGAGTPGPEPRPPRIVRSTISEVHERPPLVALLDRAVTLALDALDAAGDVVAERLGIRRQPGEPPAPSSPG
jgi:hypothetical protein